MGLWILGLALIVIGFIMAFFIKPKPGKESSLDWVGGFIAGCGMILFLAAFSAWIT
jgi:hypothetical protein